MAGEYLSTRRVAERLGVSQWRVRYALEAGHVPEPLRVGTTRFFSETDTKSLADYFRSKGGAGGQLDNLADLDRRTHREIHHNASLTD